MTIPNVVLGELIDPVTFGNAVVDAVNDHETELADRLPLSGGTLSGDLQVAGNVKAYNLQVDGGATVNSHIALPNARNDNVTASAPNLYLTSTGNVRFTTFSSAPNAFNIAPGIDTADVLERAEVATMPVVDEEGVTTTDEQTDIVTVNEVVSALLAKVKEQSEQIANLSERIAELEA